MTNQTTATAPTETQQPRYVLTSHSLTYPEIYSYIDTVTGQRAEGTLRELSGDKSFINGLSPMEAMRLGWNAATEQHYTTHHVIRWMAREGLKEATVHDWEAAGRPTQCMELDADRRSTGRDTWSDTGEYVDERCRHCRDRDTKTAA